MKVQCLLIDIKRVITKEDCRNLGKLHGNYTISICYDHSDENKTITYLASKMQLFDLN